MLGSRVHIHFTLCPVSVRRLFPNVYYRKHPQNTQQKTEKRIDYQNNWCLVFASCAFVAVLLFSLSVY